MSSADGRHTLAAVSARLGTLSDTVIELSVVVRRMSEETSELRAVVAGNQTDLALLRQQGAQADEVVARLRQWAHEGNGAPAVSTRLAALESAQVDLAARIERLTTALEAQAVRRGGHWVTIVAAVISGGAGALFAAWAARGGG